MQGDRQRFARKHVLIGINEVARGLERGQVAVFLIGRCGVVCVCVVVVVVCVCLSVLV